MGVLCRTQGVGEVEVFHREAGPPDAPISLLLHGFPTAGHMFHDLIPLLAGRYRVIAPDLPGFGKTRRRSLRTRDAAEDNGRLILEFLGRIA